MDAETVFAEIDAALGGEEDVSEGTGFGTNPGLRTGGRIFAMVVRGELVFKLPAARCAELVEGGGAAYLEMRGRRMREWVRFAPAGDAAPFVELAREARRFVAGGAAG
jgi:hypothetical protein